MPAAFLPAVPVSLARPTLHLRPLRRRRPTLPRHARRPSTPCMTATLPTQPVDIATLPPSQKSPPAAFAAATTLGASKAATPLAKVFLLAVLAGAYISLGALLALSVGGASPALAAANPGLSKFLFGAVGLPLGLTLVVTAGGELFTGNTLLVGAAALAGKARWPALALNWAVAFVGNFLGCLLIVRLAVVAACLTPPSVAVAVSVATAKVGMSFTKAFVRGLLCNWLVCLGVYLSNAASGFGSKFLAVFLPVSAFVTMGFDHSVANMFLVPMGMALGADVGWKAFLVANLWPVTLGNIVGGMGMVAGMYYLCYGKK